MNNEKNDCVESIVRTLERTAAWRNSLSAKFDDPRNKRAAESLAQLAIDAAGMTDSEWAQLKNHYSWTSLAWRNGLTEATRQIGFHNRRRDFASSIAALIREVSLSSVVAA